MLQAAEAMIAPTNSNPTGLAREIFVVAEDTGLCVTCTPRSRVERNLSLQNVLRPPWRRTRPDTNFRASPDGSGVRGVVQDGRPRPSPVGLFRPIARTRTRPSRKQSQALHVLQIATEVSLTYVNSPRNSRALTARLQSLRPSIECFRRNE